MKKQGILILLTVLLLALTLASCGKQDGETVVGIASTEINGNGELIIKYTDGTEENLGCVVGTNGEDGENGKDGADGSSGEMNVINKNNAIALATSKGIRSAVRISSKFEGTRYTGGWYPTPVTYEYTSGGAGVIYRLDKSEGDAYLITNHHVIYDASSNSENGISEEITVYLYGSEYETQGIKAEYLGGSLQYDIAVLRIEDSETLRASDAVAVTISDAEEATVGETAIAIGNPEGLGISVTSGIVSVDSEEITMLAADNRTTVTFRVMRIDTAVNSGNSGGGLFNSEGELMGIVNAKITDSQVENIAYAIPLQTAVGVADNIIDNCSDTDLSTPVVASLGISLAIADSYAKYDTDTGLISIIEQIEVYSVDESSPLREQLASSDIIRSVTVGDRTYRVTRLYHLRDELLTARVGDTVTLSVERDGVETTATVTLTEDNFTSTK